MVRVLRETNYSYLSHKARFFRSGAIVLLIAGTVIMFAVPRVGFLLGFIIFSLAMLYWKQYSDYDTGLQGEKLVSETLKELDDSYYLLEDVVLPAGNGNIDHVLVGPNGIFAIEAKNYRGKVSGHRDKWYHTNSSGFGKKEIRSVSIQVKGNAAGLNKILADCLAPRFRNRLFVEPVIVFTNDEMDLKTREPTTLVVRLFNLVDTIRSHTGKQHYSGQETATIAKSIQKICKEC